MFCPFDNVSVYFKSAGNWPQSTFIEYLINSSNAEIDADCTIKRSVLYEFIDTIKIMDNINEKSVNKPATASGRRF